MKVTVERAELLKSLGHVYRVVERRNTYPILANVLMKVADGKLDLRATDHIWRRTTPAGLTDSGTKETAWTNNLGVTVGAALHF